MLRNRFIAALMAGLAVLGGQAVAATSDDCGPLIDRFNAAINNGSDDDAQRLVDEISADALCGRFQVAAQRRLSAFRLTAVNFMMARGLPAADFERLLSAADRPQVLWQAAATVGEVRFGERKFATAAVAFDRAIEIIKNEALTPSAPSKFDIESLIDRAAYARLLAANMVAEKSDGSGFVKTARSVRDGLLGGIYSPSVRGVVPRAVLVPVTFEYAKTTFTEVGEEAARELLAAIHEQQPVRIVLAGHTDPRGSSETNMKLSQGRADAVAAFLRANGVTAPVETIGKGAAEPIRLPDATGLTEDDIFALDRRVEWLRN